VEVGNTGKLVRYVGVSSDNTCTIAPHTDYSTMLPVGDLLLVREFELAKEVLGVFTVLCCPLDLLDETREGTLFQFVNKWRFMLHAHSVLLKFGFFSKKQSVKKPLRYLVPAFLSGRALNINTVKPKWSN
jgi:hypothetical protein